MGKETKIGWREYEDLIYKIYKELEPLGTVTKNEMMMGLDSGIAREIDISLRTKVAGHDILIAIEAKKTKRRVDQKVVDGFKSFIQDIRASKGIIICNAGFTKTVRDNAKKYGIDLLTAHDASSKDWQTEIQIPVVKKNVKVQLTIEHHYVPMGPVTISGVEMPFPDHALHEFLKNWENDSIPKTPGIHYMPMDPAIINLNKDLWPLQTGIKYEITHRHHFKYFIPVDYRGLKDYLTERFTPSFMQFSESIPYLNDGTWTYIDSPESIAIDPVLLNIEIVDIDFLKHKLIRHYWQNE